MGRLAESLTGNYIPNGNPLDAEAIVVQAFGRRVEHGKLIPDPINRKLGEFAVRLSNNTIPIIAQEEVAVTIADEHVYSVGVVGAGKPPDTWDIINESLEKMKEYGLSKPMIVAHAFHAPRVARQVEKIFGHKPIVPDGLPREWDKKSTQIWTRNKYFWITREISGQLYLLGRGRL